MFRLLSSSALVCMLLVGAVSASAQMPSRNPFGQKAPAEAAAEAAPQIDENAELQFCGIFGDGENKRFLIYNVSTNKSSWLRLSEEGPDSLFVDSFNPEYNTVSVRQGARSLNLELVGATITGGTPRAGGSAPVALTGNAQQDLVNTVKVNPTPADEQRRLEAVAAEVRRRRAARAAAASRPGNSP